MIKLIVCMVTVTVAAANAASTTYRVNLPNPAWLGSSELKPGAYRLEVDGDKAIFRSGKNVVAEAPAKIETSPQKHSQTSITLSNQGSRPELREIRVGGTATSIVFPSGAGGAK
jgi:hypothetical protein